MDGRIETVNIFSRNLGRGKACDPCRSRKLRCDGVSPVCGRCVEEDDSFNDVVLDLNEGPSPAKQRRLDGKGNAANADSQNDLFFAEILSSQLPLNTASSSKSTEETSQTPHSSGDNFSTSSSSTRKPRPILQGSSTSVNLPPSQIIKLVKIFLEAYQIYSLFQPQRLLERIAKGPNHEYYPHDSALHIMIAMAYAERPDLDDSLEGGPADSRKGAHYKHTVAAQHAVFEIFHTPESGRVFLDVVRALLLICCKQYAYGDVWESYMTNSNGMRGCVGLNLNKEEPNKATLERQILNQTGLPRIADRSFLQVIPRDAIEAEEVRRTMMLAFKCDRMCCATTLWPASLAEEDYTTSMPRTTLREFMEGNFTKEIMDRTPRYLNSQDFYSAEAVDADQLMFKGCVILGKCAELISRLPRDATKDYVSSLAIFQKLENYITTLQLNNSSLAASLNGTLSNRNNFAAFSLWLTINSTSRYYNSVLISTICIPYACTLTLHEPFANLCEESENACRQASRSVIRIIRLCLAHGENELMQLQFMVIFVHGLVGRSLIRQLESLYSKLITQEFEQDSLWNTDHFTESSSLLQADLEVVLLSLKKIGYKWPIAMRAQENLLRLLQFNPEHRLRSLFCLDLEK